MEIKVQKEVSFEVKYLKVVAGVRYWEDATLNGSEDEDGKIFGKTGDMWTILIDIDTGIIANWPEGDVASINYKVCDAGEYFLTNAELDEDYPFGGYYVPSCLSIGSNGCGDYIIMKIDKDGKIEDYNADNVIDCYRDSIDENE